MLVSVATVDGHPQETPPQVQQLIKQLAESDFAQRESAEQQLISIGTPAVDLLVEELIDCKPDVCSRIKRILQSCADRCDEESLFKALAVLRIRFEVPAERIRPMLERWAAQRRAVVIDSWRRQGAVVTDPFQGLGRDEIFGMIGNRIPARGVQGQQIFEFMPRNGIKPPTQPKPEKLVRTAETETRSNVDLLRQVLVGTLEQNKKLVLESKQGADGFEKSMAMVQKQPVTVTIGEDWNGDYSIFDFSEATSVLLVSSLKLDKIAINDTVLSAFKKHPLSSVSINECSVASDLKETLPQNVSTLTISGSSALSDILRVVARKSSMLGRIRLIGTKFGEAEALTLKSYEGLSVIDLVGVDVDESTFDGLAKLKPLRRLWFERCTFPASAFIEFKQKQRRDVRVDFSAKAFLGVSGVSMREFGFGGIPRPVVGSFKIGTVVPGEAADRAGIKVGDEILQIGGQKLKSFEELRIVIAQYEIGEETSIRVLRDGKEMTLKAKLGARRE